MGEAGVLGPDTTYIHCTTLSDEEIIEEFEAGTDPGASAGGARGVLDADGGLSTVAHLVHSLSIEEVDGTVVPQLHLEAGALLR